MLTEKQMQYGMWLGKPAHLREPKTRIELAKILEVTIQSLSRWAKNPEVLEVANNYKKFEAKVHLDEVISQMTKRAIDGNSADRRLYLEWVGELGKEKHKDKEPLGRIEVEFVTKQKPKDTN